MLVDRDDELGGGPEGARLLRVVAVPLGEVLLIELLEGGEQVRDGCAELAAERPDGLDDALVVERLLQGLAGALVVELATVHAEELPAARGQLGDVDVVLPLELRQLERVNRREDIEIAGEEGRLGGRPVRDDAGLPRLDVGPVLDEAVIGGGVLVVVRPALGARAGRTALGHRVGTAARAGRELLDAQDLFGAAIGKGDRALGRAVLLDHARVKEGVVVAGAVDRGVRVGAAPVLRDRQLVRRLEVVDEDEARTRGVRAVEGVVELGEAPEAEGDGLGIDRVAVVELHAGADAPDEGRRVDLLEADHPVHGEQVLGRLVGVGLSHRGVDDLGVVEVEDSGIEAGILDALPELQGATGARGVGVRLGGGLGLVFLGRLGGGLGLVFLFRCSRGLRGRLGGGGGLGSSRSSPVVVVIIAAAGEDGG